MVANPQNIHGIMTVYLIHLIMQGKNKILIEVPMKKKTFLIEHMVN